MYVALISVTILLLRTVFALVAPLGNYSCHVDLWCDSHGGNHTPVQTKCLQHILDACHNLLRDSEQQAIVVFSAGIYHTGSLIIPSNTILRLEANATILGSINPADYPLVGALEGYNFPRDCCCNDWLKYNCSGLGIGIPPQYTMRYRALLTTEIGAVRVAVEGAGESSVIDGNGWLWWARFESLGLTAGRPHLVEPMYTSDFRIEAVWLKDSPFWTLHPYACDGVVIRDLKITADPLRGHNTDGIDPDSCSNVLVEGCYVRVGDDAVAIKSGIDAAGRRFNRPSRNMLFRNNIFETKHISIGSEESGGISNVTFQDCVLGTSRDFSYPGFNPGIHLKAERGRGGYIRDISFRRLQFFGPISQPIYVSMFYSDSRNVTNTTATPHFSNILFQDIVVTNATGQIVQGASWEDGWAGALVGIPEAPVVNITLRNVSILLGQHMHANTSVHPWVCSDVFSGSAEEVTPALPGGCLNPG